MAHSRGSHRGMRSGPRRQTSWETGVPLLTTSVPFTADISAILGTGVSPTVDGLTLVRTRGEVLLALTSAAAAGNAFVGAIGIGLASEQAFAVGATAVPLPVSEAGAESWIWHEWFSVVAFSATDFGGAAQTQRMVIDSKAMRRVEENMIIYMAIEATETGTAGLEVSANTRLLFKLP